MLDHTKLSSEDEWKRAHLVLACISHAYVWCKGDTGVVKVKLTNIDMQPTLPDIQR